MRWIGQFVLLSRFQWRRKGLALGYRPFDSCATAARTSDFILAAARGLLAGLVGFGHFQVPLNAVPDSVPDATYIMDNMGTKDEPALLRRCEGDAFRASTRARGGYPLNLAVPTQADLLERQKHTV